MKKIFVFSLLLFGIMLFSVTADNKNYEIFIDVEIRRIYLIQNGKAIKSYPCAVGKSSSPSPIGQFTVTLKEKWGEGFGGSFLGINCPWGKFGIHGTTHPETIGLCASGGCIRMYNHDAAELYNAVTIGTPVIIENGCFGAFGNGFRKITPDMYGSDLMAVQKRLADLGYYTGAIDGRYGVTTRSALHKYQKDNGFTADDDISIDIIKSMGFILME